MIVATAPATRPIALAVPRGQSAAATRGRPEQRLQNRHEDRTCDHAGEQNHDRIPVSVTADNTARHRNSKLIPPPAPDNRVTLRIELQAPVGDEFQRVGAVGAGRRAALPAGAIVSIRRSRLVRHRADHTEGRPSAIARGMTSEVIDLAAVSFDSRGTPIDPAPSEGKQP